MEIKEIKRSIVYKLRETKKQHDLSIANIMNMLETKGKYLSESTVKRLFSENSDPTSFKYQDTIAPLADVLLDFHSDQFGTSDIESLQEVIHDKNKTISILVDRDEERKADYEKQVALLQEQIAKLEGHLNFHERISEKLITREDKVVEALIAKIKDA